MAHEDFRSRLVRATRGIRSLAERSGVAGWARRRAEGRPFSRLVLWLVSHPTDHPPLTERVVHRYGCEFLVDISDLPGWFLDWGFRDPHHDAMVALLEPDDGFLDVGSNMGVTALRAAKAVGARGRVIAIEPAPDAFERLRENVRRNDAGNVTTRCVGVSDYEGWGRLAPSLSWNSGTAFLASHVGQLVRVRTVDSIVRGLGNPRVDVMKVDVEGAELAVLRGAAQTIRAQRPTIVLEVAGGDACNLRHLDAFFNTHSYRLRELVSGREIIALSERLQNTARFDVLAAPNETGWKPQQRVDPSRTT